MIHLDQKGYTILDDGISPLFSFLFLGISIILIVGTMIATSKGATQDQHQHDIAPCSSFKQDTLNDVPARCITPQGGFRE